MAKVYKSTKRRIELQTCKCIENGKRRLKKAITKKYVESLPWLYFYTPQMGVVSGYTINNYVYERGCDPWFFSALKEVVYLDGLEWVAVPSARCKRLLLKKVFKYKYHDRLIKYGEGFEDILWSTRHSRTFGKWSCYGKPRPKRIPKVHSGGA